MIRLRLFRVEVKPFPSDSIFCLESYFIANLRFIKAVISHKFGLLAPCCEPQALEFKQMPKGNRCPQTSPLSRPLFLSPLLFVPRKAVGRIFHVWTGQFTESCSHQVFFILKAELLSASEGGPPAVPKEMSDAKPFPMRLLPVVFVSASAFMLKTNSNKKERLLGTLRKLNSVLRL